MKIEPKLEQFLKEKGVMDAFIKNAKIQYQNPYEEYPVKSISEAFTWADKAEGHDFWQNLNQEFETGTPPAYASGYLAKEERKFEEITIPAIAVETKCFGAETIEVRMKVDLDEFFKNFSYSDIREYFEESIEDEILEARNEGYKRGLEEDRDNRSHEAEQRMRLRHED